MATDSNEVTKTAQAATTPKATAPSTVAKVAPTEQQPSRAGVPKRFAPGQTVCNEKTEKGKLCNGHLKQLETAHPSEVHLRGDDMLQRCQTCGTLYMGPPHGHVRDSRKQSRYIQKDLAAILQAAGGTLPAYSKEPARPAASAAKPSAPARKTPAETSPAVADSSPAADSHRPAAEAQAATGQASAAPLSPTAATASPAAGAETPADLATEASTELTPGAPKDERPKVATEQTAAPKAATAKKASAHSGFKPPAELNTAPPNETQAEKIARLKRLVEEAKRAAGKL